MRRSCAAARKAFIPRARSSARCARGCAPPICRRTRSSSCRPRDRAAVGMMLNMTGVIDVIVPRGGSSLIERVQRESRIPVIAHLEGLCHTYIHRAADPTKAHAIVLNAKMRRVSICGATETLLVDRAVAATMLPPILADLRARGCEVRGDPETLRDRAARGRGDRRRLAHRISRRHSRGACRRRRCRGDRAHQPLRLAPHRRDRDRGRGNRASAFCARSTARSCWSTPRPSSPMAASSAWAPRSASRRSGCRRAARSAPAELTTYKYLVRGTGQVRP